MVVGSIPTVGTFLFCDGSPQPQVANHAAIHSPGSMRSGTTCLALVAVLLASFVALFVYPRVVVLCGYSSKIACSAVFVQHRPLSSVTSHELAGFPWALATIEVDADEGVVRSSLPWGLPVSRTSVYEEGFGCTLLATPHATAATLRQGRARVLAGTDPRAPLIDAAASDSVASRPWPLGDAPLSDSARLEAMAGVDQAKFDAAVALAWEEPDPQRMANTRALLIAHKGKVREAAAVPVRLALTVCVHLSACEPSLCTSSMPAPTQRSRASQGGR